LPERPFGCSAQKVPDTFFSPRSQPPFSPPRASVSSVVRSPRRLAPGREHRGQSRVGRRAARVNVRDDGLRGEGPGGLARPAALLGDELRHRRRPDRLDGQRLQPRERPGAHGAVGHPPEGVQVEPDHFLVAAVQPPQDDAPRPPFQPVHDRRGHVCPERRRLPPSAAACPGTRTASLVGGQEPLPACPSALLGAVSLRFDRLTALSYVEGSNGGRTSGSCPPGTSGACPRGRSRHGLTLFRGHGPIRRLGRRLPVHVPARSLRAPPTAHRPEGPEHGRPRALVRQARLALPGRQRVRVGDGLWAESFPFPLQAERGIAEPGSALERHLTPSPSII